MSVVFLLSCPDRPGIVSMTTRWISEHGGNIVHAEQHVDADPVTGSDVFFQRIEVDDAAMDTPRSDLANAFSTVAEDLEMRVDIREADRPTPTALMASRQPHCLYDLLTRWRTGELPADLRVVISNHPDHQGICTHMGVPYVHLPVTKETKQQQEELVLDVLAEHEVELVVMARYMQILSDRFVAQHPMRIINIHHSFLPAFIGANPYRQAHERGVKLIGATAHYATADLDEGPIIEQDTERVNHRDDVKRLTSKGRDLETVVLARAVRAHLEHRILINGHKTIIFS
jgi:formyltetrahydrofolate deformylase